MGSVGKSLKKIVKKVARPKVLLPLAALAIGGPMLAKGMAGSGAAGAGAGKGLSSFLFGNAAGPIGTALHGTGVQAAATKGILGAGGSFNPLVGTAAQFVKKGLMNPIKNPLAGAATYGGLAALGMGMLGGGKETPTGPTKQAQNLYNSFLQSGRLAGYTDDEINTIYAPYGDLAYGDYETVNVDRDPRRRQFPGTNYPIFAAEGGRAGYAEGELVSPEQVLMVRPEQGGPIPDELVDRTRQKRMSLTGAQPPKPEEDEEIAEQILREILSPGVNEDSIADQMYNMQLQEMMNPRMGRAHGGIMQVAPGVPSGMELDYRNTGGFIPMGGPEKADDVPAMLSRNEFVMTADAVRGMGDGDVNAGAQKMYDLMNNLEAKA
tara:strand:+ start:252 stop:1385 length:1134 start_codon:yes stop_codon:yes gene_type:complete